MTPEEAESLLAKHPEYPSVRVRLHERNEELLRQSPPTDDSLGSKERFSFLLAQFDNFAAEYIELVSDLDSQKAFETLLNIRNQVSWVYFTGFRDTPPSSFPDEFTSLHQKTEHWITEVTGDSVPQKQPRNRLRRKLWTRRNPNRRAPLHRSRTNPPWPPATR
jgi:hypothetical protein